MFHSLNSDVVFSEAQDLEFMNCSINIVAPIIRRYKSVMAKAVDELEKHRSVSGERLKQIMGGT